jgi:hypothetical protein
MTEKQARCQHKRDKTPIRKSIAYFGPVSHWCCPYCGLWFRLFAKVGIWRADE